MSQAEESWSGSTSVDQAISGVTAGCVSTLFMHPLDLVKAKLQVQVTSKGNGLLYQLRNIAKQDGLRGLYRGLGVNILGNCSSWGLYFFWYTSVKREFKKIFNTSELNAGQYLGASATAGIAAAVSTNPIWVLKSRAFTSHQLESHIYQGVFHDIRRIIRNEGPLGLFRGSLMSIVGVSNGAIQFMAYEELKKVARRRHMAVPGVDDESIELSNTEYVVTSGLAKVLAVTITYPYQVVRTRLQYRANLKDGSQLSKPASSTPPSAMTSKKDLSPSYSSIRDVIRRTYHNEGFFAFYRGLGTNMVRVAPGASLTLLVYERMSILLRHKAEER